MEHKPSKSGFTELLAADTTLFSAEPLIGLLELRPTLARSNSPPPAPGLVGRPGGGRVWGPITAHAAGQEGDTAV